MTQVSLAIGPAQSHSCKDTCVLLKGTMAETIRVKLQTPPWLVDHVDHVDLLDYVDLVHLVDQSTTVTWTGNNNDTNESKRKCHKYFIVYKWLLFSKNLSRTGSRWRCSSDMV